MLINLEESHPEANTLLLGNGFSINRTDVPRSRGAVDITIEQTINRHAESQCGISGFTVETTLHTLGGAKPGRSEQVFFKQQEMVDMDNSERTIHMHGAKIVSDQNKRKGNFQG